jgi:hypothetical protein
VTAADVKAVFYDWELIAALAAPAFSSRRRFNRC